MTRISHSPRGRSLSASSRRGAVALESLENRTLFTAALASNGTLLILHTPSSNNQVLVSEANGLISVTETYTHVEVGNISRTESFAAAAVMSINLSTGHGHDRINVNCSKPITINAGPGNDYIRVSTARAYIRGEEGNDIIHAGASNDIVYGGSGDDYITAGAGHDFIHGDDGIDQLYGFSGNDQLFGDGGGDYLYGGDG